MTAGTTAEAAMATLGAADVNNMVGAEDTVWRTWNSVLPFGCFVTS